MNETEKLIQFLESEEVKAAMDKCVQKMVEKDKKEKEIIKQLFSNKEYIQWLIDFTEDKKGFLDSDWDYSSEKLSDNDQRNVNNLSLFFEGICTYAKKNYIYSSSRALGEYYRIKINDIGFEIGYIAGQGTSFYCKRVDINNEYNYIDYNDIILDKEQNNVKTINSSLNSLSNMIIDTYNSGVPVEAIEETVNVTMRELVSYEKKNMEQKVYRKTR